MPQPLNIGFLGATVDPLVVEAQKWLTAMKFSVGTAGVDGIMGPDTKKALNDFYASIGAQRGQSLTWNGSIQDALKDLRAVGASMGITLIGTPGALPVKNVVPPGGTSQATPPTSVQTTPPAGAQPPAKLAGTGTPFYKQPMVWAVAAVAVGGYFLWKKMQDEPRLPEAPPLDGLGENEPRPSSRCSRAPEWDAGVPLIP